MEQVAHVGVELLGVHGFGLGVVGQMGPDIIGTLVGTCLFLREGEFHDDRNIIIIREA